jgi:hypothetical protein
MLFYWYDNIMCVYCVGPILMLCVLKKFWYQFPEDGEIIAPKHVAAM